MQLRKVAKIYRRVCMVGRGREQVFTPTIQTFQKLKRTVKLGLFFYGHFGKVLSLELIFFYKFKLVLL